MQNLEVLTIKEYAERYKVSEQAVHRMIKNKFIKAVDLHNGKGKRALWRIIELPELQRCNN